MDAIDIDDSPSPDLDSQEVGMVSRLDQMAGPARTAWSGSGFGAEDASRESVRYPTLADSARSMQEHGMGRTAGLEHGLDPRPRSFLPGQKPGSAVVRTHAEEKPAGCAGGSGLRSA